MNAQTKVAAADKAAAPKPTGLEALRVPFTGDQISKLPKPTKTQTDAVKADYKKGVRCKECGSWHHPDVVHLDYVGHAALTDRLLQVDPQWSWEPVALGPDGLPQFDSNGGLWIRLTICGVTRLGYGDADGKKGGNAIKEAIGDALRNAGMRFGCALDLWHKGDLHADEDEERGPRPEPEQRNTRPPQNGNNSRQRGEAHGDGFITEEQRDIIQQAAVAAKVSIAQIIEHFGLPKSLLDLHADDYQTCLNMLKATAQKRWEREEEGRQPKQQQSFEETLDDGVPY